MQPRNVPAMGARYWAALLLASVLGANMGDFVSHVLHLGHANGLPPLALIFALVLFAESRLALGGEGYYWVAIVTLRTAATNLGDLATHDFKLDYPWVIAALAALLVVVLAGEGRITKRPAGPAGLPVTGGFYWAAMLVAGTLGTVAGDFVADDLGLGVAMGSLVLWGPLAVAFGLRSVPALLGKPTYWLAVVAVRTAGTTMGDFLAGKDGLGLGLKVSTPCMALILVLLLAVWREQRSLRVAEA